MVVQNAVKHGRLAKEAVIKGEDPGEFEFCRDRMLRELAPVGQVEEMLAARVVAEDFYRDRILDHLLMYERRIEHSLYRTMDEPRKQRLLREKDAPGEGAAEVSSAKSEVSSVLPTLHFTPATSDRPREGGTPNGDGNESCETKPIGAGSNVGGPPGGGDTQEPACQTNPICAAPNAGQVLCGTEVRNDLGRGELGETNPMGGRASS